jgi:hypothetical protein
MRTITFEDGTSQLEKDDEVLRLIQNGTPVRDFHPDHITTGVLERMADTNPGFKLIPQEYLTDALLKRGMSHFRAKSADVHLTTDYKENYRLAAIKKMAEQEITLAAFNFDLIDKRMILQALSCSMMGNPDCLLKVRIEEIDDEVALALLQKNYSPFHSGSSRFKLSTWVAAIQKSSMYWEVAIEDQHVSILKKLLDDGHWPEYSGKKPEGLNDAITRASKQNNPTVVEMALNCYIRSFPMEETLPLLKADSRVSLRESLYSTEELLPYLRQFPFLKGRVLESSLGL